MRFLNFGSKAPAESSAGYKSSNYLRAIEDRVATERMGRELIILSDYDNTLVNHSSATPEVVAAAQGLHLVIATARLASNARVKTFWEKGLVQPSVPVLVENGGSMAFYGKDELSFTDMIDPSVSAKFDDIRSRISSQRSQLLIGASAEVKRGRTMVDIFGGYSPKTMDRLSEMVDDPSIRIVDTGSTLTLQDRSVNKATGFHGYLDFLGVSREDVYVVGMGDAPNDAEIFEEADLGLAFGYKVDDLADIRVPGAYSAPAVLDAIRSGIQRG